MTFIVTFFGKYSTKQLEEFFDILRQVFQNYNIRGTVQTVENETEVIYVIMSDCVNGVVRFLKKVLDSDNTYASMSMSESAICVAFNHWFINELNRRFKNVNILYVFT